MRRSITGSRSMAALFAAALVVAGASSFTHEYSALVDEVEQTETSVWERIGS